MVKIMASKKNYTLTLKGNESVVIKTSCGHSNYYPYNEINEFLEVSGTIDTAKVELKTEYRNENETEWNYRLMRNETDSLANWQGFENAQHYASLESIDAAKNMILKAVKNVKKMLKTGKTHPAYVAMDMLVKSYNKHYSSDFYYHDTLNLADSAKSFLWILRECGTWHLSNSGEGNKQILTYCLKNNQDARYFYYNADTQNMIEIGKDQTGYYFAKLEN
jgi:hypothetical protein